MGSLVGSRFLILVLVVWAGLAFAARAEKATIFGTVRDQAGAGISGAKVTLMAERGSVISSTVTARGGTFAFADVYVGTYAVTVEFQGFEKAERHSVVVAPQQRVPVDFTLRSSRCVRGLVGREVSERDSSPTSGNYYDDGAFKSDPLSSSGEAAGYSTGAQAEVTRRLLENTARLQDDSAPTRANNETREQIKEKLQRGETAQLHHLLGRVEENKGDFVAAARDYERAAKLEATEGNILDWGTALLLQHAYLAAHEAFVQGVEHYPRSSKLHLGLGVALHLHGEYEAAVKALMLASDLAPSDPRPYLFLAEAYRGSSAADSDEVKKRLSRFVQLQPQNGLAHYCYAMSLWKDFRRQDRQAKLDDIESSLRRALGLNPGLADAHMQLGMVLEERQKPLEAIVEYEHAVNLQPHLAVAHYHLGQLYIRTGKKELGGEELALYERLRKQEATKQGQETQRFIDTLK